MVSRSRQPPPPPNPQAPRSGATILSLGDDLLREIFLRLPSLPSLVRAALACPAFLAAARSSPAFRRRFTALRPPPLLGLFFDYDGAEMPSFRPVRHSSDPDLAAAVRGADVFLTCVPGGDDASPGWRIAECRGGFLLLLNESTEQIAVYNPLSRALDLFPGLPDDTSDGRRGKFIHLDTFLLSSHEAPGSFQVVSVFHDESRLRAAVFSSVTREWKTLPWSKAAPAAQPPRGRKEHWLLSGTQVKGKMYWSHSNLAYKVVLDTKTMQFSFIDLPDHLKGKDHPYVAGEAKDGKPCIVSVAGFTLSIWFRRAVADGVEEWMLDSVIPLQEEVLGATKGSLEDHLNLK